MKHNTSKILEFKSTRESVKVLGIFLGYNQDKIIEENFLSRIRKMKTKFIGGFRGGAQGAAVPLFSTPYTTILP